MLLSEAFEAYILDELESEDRSPKTILCYRTAYRSLVRSIGEDIDVSLLTYLHILKWKKDMHDRQLSRDKPTSTSHIASQLRYLRRILAFLAKHAITTLDAHEIKIPHFKNKETAWLTVEELKQFFSVIDEPRDKALFACLFSAGGRISEVLSLNRDSIVNGEAKIIGKGKKPGILQFDRPTQKVVEDYLSTRTDKLEALFVSRQHARITPKTAIWLAHKYQNLSGIDKNITTHVMRHSFGTDLEMNGLDIHAISVQLRHSKIETTRRYLHGAELIKKDNYEKYHTVTPL